MNDEHRYNPYAESEPPEVSPDGRCFRCRGLGAWLTPQGIVTECPNLQLKFNDHPEPSLAAAAILRAGRRLQSKKLVANDLSFRVARALAYTTSTEPAHRDGLITDFYDWSAATKLREFHYTIEDLRSNWLLPVGSRKSQPYGYWIITDEKDFREWVTRSTSAPIKQLTTIHAVARANFPVFAEQLEFEFWSDAEQENLASASAAPEGQQNLARGGATPGTDDIKDRVAGLPQHTDGF